MCALISEVKIYVRTALGERKSVLLERSLIQKCPFKRGSTVAIDVCPLRTLPRAGHGADVKCVDWHPRKNLLVSGSKDNQQPIKLWDPKAGQSVSTM